MSLVFEKDEYFHKLTYLACKKYLVKSIISNFKIQSKVVHPLVGNARVVH